MLWSLRLLAAGLVALLRFGFGSLFMVGESAAEALLRSTGADIAGTVNRLQADPLLSAGEAAIGVLASTGAVGLALRRPGMAGILAAGSGAEAWWYGMPVMATILAAAFALCALGIILPARG